MTLLDLTEGATGRIQAVGGARSFRRRLLELGLVPGTPVTVRTRSALGGTLDLVVSGGRLSIRCTEAAMVAVGYGV